MASPTLPTMTGTLPCPPPTTSAAGLPITTLSPTPGIGPENFSSSASGLPGTTGSC
jgi:hypothetical protein